MSKAKVYTVNAVGYQSTFLKRFVDFLYGEGKTVIITHYVGEITKDHVMDEIVGTITREGFRDGEDVRCKSVIHDIEFRFGG